MSNAGCNDIAPQRAAGHAQWREGYRQELEQLLARVGLSPTDFLKTTGWHVDKLQGAQHAMKISHIGHCAARMLWHPPLKQVVDMLLTAQMQRAAARELAQQVRLL